MDCLFNLKEKVRDFWNEKSCGEALYLSENTQIGYTLQLIKRYQLESEIVEFADFKQFKNKKVLEIGVGLGADHQMIAQSQQPMISNQHPMLYGIDLTERAISHTKNRFNLLGLQSELQVADAENLPFADNMFDAVYSWGVLHHTPNTQQAISEVLRVLKSGGVAKIMIYHKKSLVGIMLWIRYALMRGRLFRTLQDIYFTHLESIGTKAYSIQEARELFKNFSDVSISISLGHGDLLTSSAGQRHAGIILTVARIIWPRWFFKLFFKKYGLFMKIAAKK